MNSFLLKVIASPIAVILSGWLFPNVYYQNYYQAMVVGFIIAAVGVAMEYILLKKGTLWMSTIADFAVSVLMVYIISNMFEGAEVTFFGAILTGAILAIIEYFVHLWLIRSGKTQKSPAS